MAKKKYYTHKEVMARLKKRIGKKPVVVNRTLKKYLHVIVNKELGKEYRAEAMRILLKASKEEIGEFLYAYHSDETKCGLCCIALDFIKDRLHKDGLVKKGFGNKFGLLCKPENKELL